METPISILKKANLNRQAINNILQTWNKQDLYDPSKIDYMKMAIEDETKKMYNIKDLSVNDKAADEAFWLLYLAYTDLYLINHNWEIEDDYENYLSEKMDYLYSLTNEELLKAFDCSPETVKAYGTLNNANYMNLVIYLQTKDITAENKSQEKSEIDLDNILKLIQKHNIALEAEDVLMEIYEEENDFTIDVPDDKKEAYDNYLKNLEALNDDEKLRLLESYDINMLRNYEYTHALLKEYLESKVAVSEAEDLLGPQTQDFDAMFAEAENILNGRSK